MCVPCGRACLTTQLCSGSGCIALLLASRCPPRSTDVYGFDVAASALALARENLRQLDLPNAASFHRADLRDDFVSTIRQHIGDSPVDLIVSNPPYIRPSEYDADAFARSVRDYEDRIALVGELEDVPRPHGDGLAFYRRVLDGIGKLRWSERLVESEVPSLVFEIGSTQADAVTALCRSASFERVEMQCDELGLPRSIWAWRR